MSQCADIDECEENISGCNDTCVNTDGSFYCECQKVGYEVGPDGLSCVGKYFEKGVLLSVLEVRKWYAKSALS